MMSSSNLPGKSRENKEKNKNVFNSEANSVALTFRDDVYVVGVGCLGLGKELPSFLHKKSKE